MTDKAFAFAVILLGVSLVAPAAPSVAAERQKPYIEVSATGKAEAAPDNALLSLTVLRTAKTARAALDDNNAAMAQVLAAMRTAGVEARDLQTSGFSVQPRYLYPKPDKDGRRPAPILTGYAVSNRLAVHIRKIGQAGEILDKAVSLGVNKVDAIRFIVDDAAQLLIAARQRAMKKAIRKARTLTAAAGVSLGDILAISERNDGFRPVPMMEAQSLMSKSAAAVPVAAGEVSYSVTVNVRWALAQ